jgi:hypothetical protein
MSSNLQELDRLAKQECAVVTLVCGHGGIRVTWKAPGKGAVIVADRDPQIYPHYSRTEGLLHTLIERLGFQGVPTNAHWIDRMTSQQRRRMYELAAEFKAIKAAALGHAGPIEPVHASPRSSLHPQHWDGEED